MLDRFECYELCVQSARHVVEILRAVHGGAPRVLREDFCGTAAVSRRWTADGTSSAVAVDIDADVLTRAAELARREGASARVKLVRRDLLARTTESEDRCDVLFVGNFSIGYFHDRAGLVKYLRECRGALADGGVFVCDTYGGASAFRRGGMERKFVGSGSEVVRYSWVHESADPLTGIVENSISFRIEHGGEVVAEMPRAFVYRWRLWSIAELREAMAEAGFAATDVYNGVGGADTLRPITAPEELGEDWTVLIAARC